MILNTLLIVASSMCILPTTPLPPPPPPRPPCPNRQLTWGTFAEQHRAAGVQQDRVWGKQQAGPLLPRRAVCVTAMCAACDLVRQGAAGAAEQSSLTFVEEVPQRARRLVQQGPEQRGVHARRTIELSKRDV